MKNCVYFLKCSNNRYYIGSSIDLNNRFQEHSSGKVKSTKNILPVELIFYQSYETISMARKIEYKLKKLKNKTIIEQIIKDGFIKIK